MKRLILLSALLLIYLIGHSQAYKEYTLCDISGVTGDTTLKFSLNPPESGGQMVEIDFTTVDCNTLTLKCGYGLTDKYPRYPETFSGLTNPVTLSKNTYSETYLGIESNGFAVDFNQYNGTTLWFHLVDDPGCTSGEIKIIIKQ